MLRPTCVSLESPPVVKLQAEVAAKYGRRETAVAQKAFRTFTDRHQAGALFKAQRYLNDYPDYEIDSIQWSPGSWGPGAFIMALLLCWFVVGVFVLIYMVLVKPPGTLTVSYVRSEPMLAAPVPA
jgi:hypothetical protein